LSGIRVTYSGLISLVFGLGSIILGLAFMLIVTRTLGLVEYGTWGLITGLIVYAVIIEPIFSFWAIRETARSIPSGKTSIVSTSFFSIVGIIVYFIAVYLVGLKTDADLDVLLFGFILVPLIFLNKMLTAINIGWKPHVAMVGTFIFSVTEVVLALLLVYFLNMGIWGVILTISGGYIISNFVLFVYARNKIKNKLNFKFLRKWLKLFWLPLYPAMGISILLFDVTIFSVITGSVIGLAFWIAATAISKLVENSSLISGAVYPKLLQEDNYKYLGENLTQLFYFAILFTGLSIVFAKPGLFVLNPQYEVAVPIAIILSIKVFFFTIASIFLTILSGIEKVDLNEKSTFRDYIKSKLFRVPTILLVQSIIYIIVLTIGLVLLQSQVTQMELLIYWAVLALIIQIPFTLYSYILIRRNFTFTINLKSIFKYFLTAIGVYGIIYFYIENNLLYTNNIFEFLPQVLLFIVLAVSGYILVTYLIDVRIKNLVKAIIKEIKNK